MPTTATLPPSLPRDNHQLRALALNICADLESAKDDATWRTRVDCMKAAKYRRLVCFCAAIYLNRGRVDLAERLLRFVSWNGA